MNLNFAEKRERQGNKNQNIVEKIIYELELHFFRKF